MILLGSAAFVAPLILLNSAMNDYNSYLAHPRYEDMYASSGCSLLFSISLALVCLYFLLRVYSAYWGSKGVYTYLTLPVRRESLYLSKLIVFFTFLLVLIGMQLIVMRLGYSLVTSKAESYEEGKFIMHNGFFLSVVRSEIFRLVLPLNVSRILSSLSLFLVLATGIYYGALCERSRNYWGFLPVGIAAYLIFKVLIYRLNEITHINTPKSLYPSSFILIVLAGFFIWHSLRMMRRGTIA